MFCGAFIYALQNIVRLAVQQYYRNYNHDLLLRRVTSLHMEGKHLTVGYNLSLYPTPDLVRQVMADTLDADGWGHHLWTHQGRNAIYIGQSVRTRGGHLCRVDRVDHVRGQARVTYLYNTNCNPKWVAMSHLEVVG